jgi:hypothetical protein
MKLTDLQEARYAFPNYVEWVEEKLHSGIRDMTGPTWIEIPQGDYDLAFEQLTKHYGQYTTQTDLYHMWQNKLGEKPKFDLILWPKGYPVKTSPALELKLF